MSAWIDKDLMKYLESQFQLDWNGIHGYSHWARVKHNAEILANMYQKSGHVVHRPVIELFALLHDHKREDDGYDFGHGMRAAEELHNLRGKLFDLPDNQFEMLWHACAYHSDGLTRECLTVQICWDADRLDLARVGITPAPRYLCTDKAKSRYVIDAAIKRSIESMR